MITQKNFLNGRGYNKLFFVVKYFGSGVILATALIHLLTPAQENLNNPCLTGPITEYSWVEGILLMTIMAFLFIDILVRKFTVKQSSQGGFGDPESPVDPVHSTQNTPSVLDEGKESTIMGNTESPLVSDNTIKSRSPLTQDSIKDAAAELTGVFILEFGIVFHSVFVGLSLAVSGDEFITLYIVLVFHQMFEGLGLGTRLAITLLPKMGPWVTYGFASLYGLATPVAIAIGLGVRSSFEPGSPSSLIVNGILYSISAGILIYTSLVELIAHEFLFSGPLASAPPRTVAAAFVAMCMGAGLMALLGKWA